MGKSYKDAGVDIDAGNEVVRRIGPLAKSTRRPGVVADLGGFGGFFDPRAAGFTDPILVAATDGVGTKLRIAIESGRYETIGIDLVAMCVNDLIVQGAEPLFFLDYYASGRLSPDIAESVIGGIAAGCRAAGCALIGGETAEMPGVYAGDDFDLAGFAVGAVERGRALTGEDIAPGDILLGLASDGLHSNGFSLVRQIVADENLNYDEQAPFERGQSLGEALLAPTRIYVQSCLGAVRAGLLKGLVHITGGGFTENIPRILPAHLTYELEQTWPLPEVFQWLQLKGKIAPAEMQRIFNCGIGMVAIVDPQNSEVAAAHFHAAGETVYEIGRVTGEAVA